MYAIGASVEIHGGDSTKAASLGGFVLVNTASGARTLFGPTAGHPVHDFEYRDINSIPALNPDRIHSAGELGTIVQVSRQYDWALIRIEVPVEIPAPANVLDKFFNGELHDAISQNVEVCGKATSVSGTLTSSSYAFLPFARQLVEVLDFLPDHAGGSMPL